MSDQIKVFVASTPSEWLPVKVLEFSIKQNTNCPVSVFPIYKAEREIPKPIDPKNHARTPFSFQRFLIPELCRYSGKAIYLDADMQVFRDISEVWNQPFNGCDMQTVSEGTNGRRGQFSVVLLNCEQLIWKIEDIVAALDSGKLTYNSLMYEMEVAKHIGHDISPEWNSLEHYNQEKTSLLHYTDMVTQPWVSINNPLEYLWIRDLIKAVSEGFITREEIIKNINNSYVRPSLIYQVDNFIENSEQLPLSIKSLDNKFLAPYKSLKFKKSNSQKIKIQLFKSLAIKLKDKILRF